MGGLESGVGQGGGGACGMVCTHKDQVRRWLEVSSPEGIKGRGGAGAWVATSQALGIKAERRAVCTHKDHVCRWLEVSRTGPGGDGGRTAGRWQGHVSVVSNQQR